MGTYSTITTLQVNMIGTTFDSVTTALATNMITKAENEINKYLSKRYSISSISSTSTSVPPLVKSLCDDLAEGYMHQKMSRGGKDAMARGKTMIDQVIENLKLIQEYKANLLDTSGSVIADSATGGMRVLSSTSSYTDTFAEDNELNWSVDTDKLDDIDSARD